MEGINGRGEGEVYNTFDNKYKLKKHIEENDIPRHNHIKLQSKLKNTNKSKTSVYYKTFEM